MSGAALSDAQRTDWLRLIRTDSIGPRTFRALVNRYGGAGPALEALPDLARKSGRSALKIVTRRDAEREIEAAGRLGARFVALGEPAYPKPLQAIDTAPPLIAVRGSAEALARPAIAIVGSRNASAAGLTFAARLARDFGEAGYAVVSGLARGIDASAHKAALAGGTVAVLAGGHDRIYPAQHEPLLQRILAEGGAVLSEMPLGWEPRGRDFPRRNRIVSGLCYGVVVVEAARRSGSLITARFALEQGREVFAVPGSPVDPRAEGTNDLIRNGATLCAEADHVIAVVAPLLGQHPKAVLQAREPDHRDRVAAALWDELDVPGLDIMAADRAGDGPLFDAYEASRDPDAAPPAAERILALLSTAPVSIDEIVREADLPARSVQLALAELELAGRLERHGGNAVSLIPES